MRISILLNRLIYMVLRTSPSLHSYSSFPPFITHSPILFPQRLWVTVSFPFPSIDLSTRSFVPLPRFIRTRCTPLFVLLPDLIYFFHFFVFEVFEMRHAQLVMGPAGCGVYLRCKFSSSVCLCVCGHSYACRSLLTRTVLFAGPCSLHFLILKSVVSYYHRQKYLEECCLILPQAKGAITLTNLDECCLILPQAKVRTATQCTNTLWRASAISTSSTWILLRSTFSIPSASTSVS